MLLVDWCICCRYVEDNITARLCVSNAFPTVIICNTLVRYRQAPLNSIWEGSGNVQCIDILRAMTTHKDSIHSFFRRVYGARGASAQFDAFAAQTEARAEQMARRVACGEDASRHARALADDMAVCLQATIHA